MPSFTSIVVVASADELTGFAIGTELPKYTSLTTLDA